MNNYKCTLHTKCFIEVNVVHLIIKNSFFRYINSFRGSNTVYVAAVENISIHVQWFLFYFRHRKLNFAKVRLPQNLECNAAPSNGIVYQGPRSEDKNQYTEERIRPSTTDGIKRNKKINYDHPDWVLSNLTVHRLNITDKCDAAVCNEPEQQLSHRAGQPTRTVTCAINTEVADDNDSRPVSGRYIQREAGRKIHIKRRAMAWTHTT